MSRVSVQVGLMVVGTVLAACITVVPPATQAPNVPLDTPAGVSSPTLVAPTVPPPVAPTAAPPVAISPAPGQQPLLPDPVADHTTGDTARVSGGEFVGDQADVTVLDAVVLPAAEPGASRYAFLVEITGLDPEVFPYNLRDFRLIDDQNFQHEPLFAGGAEPRLEFGNLAPDQKVRGWLTFEVPTETSRVELEFAPALALEAATFDFVVP